MNEMICYLQSHPEIKKIVLLVKENCDYPYIKGFFNNLNIRKLIIIGRLSKQSIEEITLSYIADYSRDQDLQLEFSNAQNFNGIDGNWALCADNGDPAELLQLSRLRPVWLLASVHEDYITSFKLWEAYKNCTSHIQIKTLRNNKEPQILAWDRNEKTDIELSIIFPMYNVADYLDKCISSVTEWKAPYIEYLFVNDGSPDNSREIVLKWAKGDSRIKLLDKPNGGCASARQWGMERAQGQYIGFIDPDDFVDESMFRKLLRAAMMGSYEISYCGYNEYYENTKNSRRVEDALGWPYCDGISDMGLIRDLIIYSPVAIWRRIYKTEMLKRTNLQFYTELRRFDDLPFKIETFAYAKSVIAVPEYLYYYRLSRPGQDVSADDERLYVHFDIFNHLNKSIASSQDAKLIDLLQMCKIQTHIYAMQKIKPEYKNIYIKRAKLDLDTTGTVERTYAIAEKRIGKNNAKLYKDIVNEKIDQF